VVYEIYLNQTLNVALTKEKEQLIKEQEILKEINERLTNDEEYKEAYKQADKDDIIILP